jgi:hypothetical protein
MPEDQGRSSNPFIRFKNNIDSKIGQIFSTSQAAKGDKDQANSSDNAEDGNSDIPSNIVKQSEMAEATETSFKEAAEQSFHGAAKIPDVKYHALVLQNVYLQSWMTYSPYSPAKLEHFPRQPVPKDDHWKSDEHFTFSDAFEDLLTVASGQPMRSIDQLSEQKRLQNLKPAPGATKPRRLVSVPMWENASRRKLWDAYLPRADFEQSAERVHAELISTAERLGKDFDAKKLNSYGMELMKKEIGRFHPQDYSKMNKLFAKVSMGGSAADHEELQKQLQERYPWLDENWEEEWRKTQTKEQSRDAQTEEDLYQNQHQRARSAIIPLIWETRTKRQAGSHDVLDSGNGDEAAEESVQYSSSGEKTVTRNEKKILDGVTQVKQTITRYDSEGNVRSRSVVTRGHSGEEGDEMQTQSRSYTYSYAWGNRSQAAGSDAQHGVTDKADVDGNSEGKKRGWFWSSWN